MAKQNLLLVDDDDRRRRVLDVSLRNAGFAVTSLADGAQALEHALARPPLLVLSNTRLPGLDGFGLCDRLKTDPATTEVAFVFLSDDARVEAKVRGLELGADDYLTRPIYIQELVARIGVVLQRKARERLAHDGTQRAFGSLEEVGPVDLLLTLSRGQKTGVLRVEGRRPVTVWLEAGAVIDAEAGLHSGEEAIHLLITRTQGRFSVTSEAIDRPHTVRSSVEALVSEGMRRLDSWHRTGEQLPGFKAVFALDHGELAERQAELPPAILDLLRLFDGRRSVLEVVEDAALPALDALVAVARLYFEGLLYEDKRAGNASEPGPTPTEGGRDLNAWLARARNGADSQWPPAPVDQVQTNLAALNLLGSEPPGPLPPGAERVGRVTRLPTSVPPPVVAPPSLAPEPLPPPAPPTPRSEPQPSATASPANAGPPSLVDVLLSTASQLPVLPRTSAVRAAEPSVAPAPAPGPAAHPAASPAANLAASPAANLAASLAKQNAAASARAPAGAAAPPAASTPALAPSPATSSLPAAALAAPQVPTRAITDSADELSFFDGGADEALHEEHPAGGLTTPAIIGLGLVVVIAVAAGLFFGLRDTVEPRQAPRDGLRRDWHSSILATRAPASAPALDADWHPPAAIGSSAPAAAPSAPPSAPESAAELAPELPPETPPAAPASAADPVARPAQPAQPAEPDGAELEAARPAAGGDFDGLMGEGMGLHEKRQYGKAAAQFRKAVAARPGNEQALVALANALIEDGAEKEALKTAQSVSRINPNNARAHLIIGSVRQNQGQKEAAIEAYERYLSLAPTGELAREVQRVLDGMRQ